MLVGEQLGGRHQGYLAIHLDCLGSGERGHERFAAAHVALNQAQHGLGQGEVAFDLGEHAPNLCLGQSEGQYREQAALQ